MEHQAGDNRRRRLLRARGKRPCGRGAAERGYEFPPTDNDCDSTASQLGHADRITDNNTTCVYRKLHSAILVVNAAEKIARWNGWIHYSRRHMRPDSGAGALHRIRNAVQAPPAVRANKPLNVSVLPG